MFTLLARRAAPAPDEGKQGSKAAALDAAPT
jgi:hypothetical protein